MNTVFADTHFYVALISKRDAAHDAALEWVAFGRPPLVTTEFVLLEVANFFARPGERQLFSAVCQAIEGEPGTTVVPAESSLFRRGLSLFNSRPDKEWSLTDCISFVVMQEHGLTEALTADRHFEQAGFSALLLA